MSVTNAQLQAVSGATVQVTASSGAVERHVTDDSGLITLDFVPTGAAAVAVEPPLTHAVTGSNTAAASITSGTTQTIRFVLRERMGRIDVHVIDTTGAPVAGAEVLLRRTGTDSVVVQATSAAGVASFDSRPGPHEVVLNSAELEVTGPRTVSVTVIDSATATRRFDVDIPPDGSWVVTPWLLQEDRGEHAIAFDGVVAFAVGGFHSRTSPGISVERWRGPGTSWEPVTDLPVPVNHTAAVLVNGRLHVIGGYHGVTFSPVAAHQIYDVANDSWTSGPPLPAPRGAHAAVVFENRIHVIGGVSGGVTASHDVYDIAAGTWSTAAPFPNAREHLTAAVAGERIYVIGGRRTFNLRDVDVYDPVADSWSAAAPLNDARSGITAVVSCGDIVVFGGEDLQSGSTIARPERFDAQLNQWQRLRPMPTPRHGIGAAVFGPDIFVIGGGAQAGFFFSSIVERLRLKCN